MTVSSTTRRSGPFAGNGVTTSFDYEFRILAPDHISVFLTEGGEDTLVDPSEYTVTGAGDANGGSVIFSTPPATGQSITILRRAPFTQDVDLENQGAFFAEVIEEALDLAVMRDQQLQEQVDRAIKFPVSVGGGGDADALISDILRFGRLYLGEKSSPPTLDNDGNALIVGATYWDTGSEQMFTWSGTEWKPTFLTGNVVRNLTTATAGQTAVTVPTYLVGANTLSVFLNGLRVLVGIDYVETDQSTITFTSELTGGDEVEAIALQPFAINAAVTFLPQSLDASQQAQARQNIGAGLDLTAAQSLNEGQQAQVRENIQAVGVPFESYSAFLNATVPAPIDVVSFIEGGRVFNLRRRSNGSIVQANGQTWAMQDRRAYPLEFLAFDKPVIENQLDRNAPAVYTLGNAVVEGQDTSGQSSPAMIRLLSGEANSIIGQGPGVSRIRLADSADLNNRIIWANSPDTFIFGIGLDANEGRGGFNVVGEGVDVDGDRAFIGFTTITGTRGEGIDADGGEYRIFSNLLVERSGGNGIHLSDQECQWGMATNSIVSECGILRLAAGQTNDAGVILRGDYLLGGNLLLRDNSTSLAMSGSSGENHHILANGIVEKGGTAHAIRAYSGLTDYVVSGAVIDHTDSGAQDAIIDLTSTTERGVVQGVVLTCNVGIGSCAVQMNGNILVYTNFTIRSEAQNGNAFGFPNTVSGQRQVIANGHIIGFSTPIRIPANMSRVTLANLTISEFEATNGIWCDASNCKISAVDVIGGNIRIQGNNNVVMGCAANQITVNGNNNVIIGNHAVVVNNGNGNSIANNIDP